MFVGVAVVVAVVVVDGDMVVEGVVLVIVGSVFVLAVASFGREVGSVTFAEVVVFVSSPMIFNNPSINKQLI